MTTWAALWQNARSERCWPSWSVMTLLCRWAALLLRLLPLCWQGQGAWRERGAGVECPTWKAVQWGLISGF